MRINQKCGLLFLFFGNLFRFFSPALSPFAYLFKGSLLPVIVLLSHEMWLAFFPTKEEI